MTGALVTAGLITSALLLTLVVPRALARWERLRTAPAAALLLWQTVSVAGVVCALLAAPVAAATLGPDHPVLLAVAVALSLLMLARLLLSGHRVGTDLRRMRARHRQVLDLVGDRLEEIGGQAADDPVDVVVSASPTAYCLPGRNDRIVLSSAAVDRLDEKQLRAVLAHEHTHLHQRHDLLLEHFTVLHEAVPTAARSPRALREVHLLTEALADRGAARRTDPRDLGGALVAMALPTDSGPDTRASEHQASEHQASDAPTGGAPYPVAVGPALVTSTSGSQVRTRLGLLAAPATPVWLTVGLVVAALAVLLLPLALLLALV